MPDFDELQEILGTLRRNLLRTTLTAVGVFWGVLMLMIMVGFGNGLEGGVRRDMAGMTTNSLYVWGDKTSLPYGGTTPGRWVKLTAEDAEALVRAIPSIEAIAPRASLGGRGGTEVVVRNDKSGPFTISGDVPDYVRVQPQTIVEGRFLNQLDMDRKRKVAVIGVNVAEVLFPEGGPIVGQTIQIKRAEYVVVGVFKSPVSGDRADRLHNTIHLPLTTFHQALRPDRAVNNLGVLVRQGSNTEEVEALIFAELAELHHFSPDDKQAVGVWNADKEFQKISGLFRGISLLILFVGSVTLAAGIIGVSNIMMISVRERTREIGVRRAIGATPLSIVGQILKESTLLTAIAGYLGLAGGVAALELIGRAMEGGDKSGGPSLFDPPTADFRVAVAATALVVLGGALAGLFPALHAVRIRPVVALRDE